MLAIARVSLMAQQVHRFNVLQVRKVGLISFDSRLLEDSRCGCNNVRTTMAILIALAVVASAVWTGGWGL